MTSRTQSVMGTGPGVKRSCSCLDITLFKKGILQSYRFDSILG
ncbi:MAG: hypothetical protein ACO34C_05060 [Candidatus Kapaibacteriota bacterium]